MSETVRIATQVKPVVPLLDYQRADVESNDRFRWCCWSRQIGKSFTKSLRRVLRGMLRRRNQILLSAGERQSRELMLKVRQHCQALNIASSQGGEALLRGMSAKSLTLELPNQVRIIGLPANPQTARGFTGDVFLDEFAMHREDRAIWAAVFPSVLRGDGELDVASTPKGKDNLFAQLRDNPYFTHSVVTLEQAIGAGLEVDAAAIRQSMNDEELYRQEFLCEFVDEQSAFLTYEQIGSAEDPLLEKDFDLNRLSERTGAMFVGMDIGRCRDLTVIWVVEAVPSPEGFTGQGARWVGKEADPATRLDCAKETELQAGQTHGTKNQSAPRTVLITRGVRETLGEPFREQLAALREVMSWRHVRRCCIDAGGMGLPLAEAAAEEFGSVRVESVVFTASVKDEMASRLRMRVEDGTIRIPLDAAIRNDWHSVRRSITSAGPARYEAARSGIGHADRFWAACLAVRAAGGPTGEMESLRGSALRFARVGVW